MTKDSIELGEAGAGREPRGGERKRGIDRVIMLLEALLKHRAPARVGDIAKMINAPRSTTYEMVNSLLEAEMLENVGAEGHVYFGRAMHLFGWAYGHHNAHYRRIIEAMERIAIDTQQTVQICGLRGNKYIVFDCRDSPGPFRISSDVGVEVPIPWTASGRLFVAHMTLEELTAFIPPEDFRMQDGRVIEPERFLAEAKAARERGICVIGGLVDDYATCVAAPIVVEPGGKCVACICFIVSSSVGRSRIQELTRLLMESARKLSRIEEETAAIGR